MKRLLVFFVTYTLLSMSAQSQQPVKNYEAAWKKVEDFVKKQLPQSALKEVKDILALAKKEKQEAQVLKSVIYISTLQGATRENNEVLSIKELEAELPQVSGASKAVLYSILAQTYLSYYENIRWQLYERTQTTNFQKDDIATWGTEDFHKKIGDLFLASLEPEEIVKATRLEPYAALIQKGNMRHLRPTLFDMLAHEALSYFQNDERNISKPAYAFELNQAAAFEPVADFIHRQFPTQDTGSLQYKALLLWQKLLAFHSKDDKYDALIDADLGRLSFVESLSTHPDKNELYFQSVNHIAHQYESIPAAAQAWYLVANYYHERGSGYKPYGDSTYRMDLVKAKEICERVVAQKDSSEGRVNAFNLLQRIQLESLHFSVEKVNIPSQAFRAFVKYRNMHQLHLRIIPADEKLLASLEKTYGDAYWNILLKAKAFRSWDQSLPTTNDLQEHSVEIKVDGLPAGAYMLLAGNDKDFANKKTTLGAQLFYVSGISFINNESDFFLLHRESGQPLANASVQLWEQKYDYTQSKYVKERKTKHVTDKNGYFLVPNNNKDNDRYGSYSFLLDIQHGNDKLFINEQLTHYRYRNREDEKKAETTSFLFLDRSLYRPGQIVYFKGIVFSKTTALKKASVLENYTTTIYLNDANNEEIDSLKITTNEFGSFSGRFQLPTHGLTGSYSLEIKDQSGYNHFQVEEYKRPKFFAEYKPLQGTYKVNDTIAVNGFAQAYAGNTIDGATVKYRVVRQARFLYPWLFKRWWMPPADAMEIIHGKTTTDKEGKFTVSFTAIPDLKVDKKLEPVFDYTVYADITDINGETRSASQTVSVGYKGLIVHSSIPASLVADSLKTLTIHTQNMNGEFEAATIAIAITKLDNEKRLIRNRYWGRPDQFLFTKEEYIKHFPYDEYNNEQEPESWAKSGTTFTHKDSSQKTGQWQLPKRKWEKGHYIIEITATNEKGEEVKDIKYIELYDATDKQLNTPAYLWSKSGDAIEPGEKSTVVLGSSADNLFLIHQTDKQKEKQQYTFSKLNKEKKSFVFEATEADRGGYGVSWIFVKHNRVYQYTQTIYVPWSNKDLQISYATYRDKAIPGSDEKWTLKITGYKNEKVAAELLGSMYDASLDQFYPHQWYKPSIWPSYYNRAYWNSSLNFTKVETNQKRTNNIPYQSLNKQYDQFLFAHYVRRAGNGYYRRFEMSGNADMMAAPMASKENLKSVSIQNSPITLEEKAAPAPPPPPPNKEDGSSSSNEEVQVRKNFNETAFFLPDLRTDSSGTIEFSFTLPEALTRWKFQALAHTKELALGYSSKEIVTQKELMVQPNPTRFLREEDRISFSAKIVNLSDKDLTGTAEFHLFDAATNQPVDALLQNSTTTQSFTVKQGESIPVSFPITVPDAYTGALVWRIVAKAATFSDGEENILPVLSNRLLVTETLPINVKGNTEKTFRFEKLLNSGKSNTLEQHALTIEYSSNPAWYAVQALPYLMEYPYECAEQNWNRYYANSLATHIANASPRIQQIFEKWRTLDTAALLSNLQKNQELKSLLLEETPWVLQAKNEAEQKRNIALLFDMVKMSAQLTGSFEKLKQMQSSNGGFVWFSGGPDDRYITQYIITGIGHLKKLNAIAKGQEQRLNEILASAIPYLDRKIKEDYDQLVKDKIDLKKYTPSYTAVQYLYMRSFFPEYKIPAATQAAYNYFRSRLPLTWTSQNKYMQGMTALTLHRTNDSKTATAILKSLKETSINHEELGRYWKDASRSWWWYEAPIERQALLIEAFQEISKETNVVNELRTWLLKNKQTNSWESTKATAEACYALLLQNTNWVSTEPTVVVKLGNTVIASQEEQQEAGTGYFKKALAKEAITPAMGNISVKVAGQESSASSWGSVYWQYFEKLDKITTANTPLQLNKKLFVEKNSDRGPILTPVNEGDNLSIGNKIKVRIELRVDRDMEYVHMKDMRASSLEPVNVLSGYRWQGGLGYYETTKDASTNFFFNYLRKGTYVFEYTLFVTHSGSFSNGITTIQCMYAPEFTAHSEGIRIEIK